ncbi:thioredoxin family protein [Jiulongibacter sp. NS-SX5]|uniref:thioredoxin family protein n=1 Tax=Jiulongibacter sp. NS-SX5 TaxID=3463854 RepID=UPI00405865E5
MIKKTYAFILTILVFFSGSAFMSSEKQENTEDLIQWMTIDEAFAATQQNPKKTLIDVYTDWCGWCKVMDKKTFRNPAVAKYVNENYYPVKLNAETKEDIKLGNTVYSYNEQNRANDIAVALLQGKMSFPSIVYLDEQFNMIQPIPGYQDAGNFHQVITFIGENYHKKEAFDQYKSSTYKKMFSEEAVTL